MRIENTVTKDFIDTLIQNSNDGLIADNQVRREPFLQELDFHYIERAICGYAANKSDQFVDLT